jgi:hypothetical protein
MGAGLGRAFADLPPQPALLAAQIIAAQSIS